MERNSNVTLIGKVSKGLEVKTVPVGDGKTGKVGNFSIAVNTGKTDDTGKDVLTYYGIESWDLGQQGLLRDQLKVGELIAVVGNLKVDNYSYDDQETGGKKYGIRLIVKNPNVQFLGNQSGNSQKDPVLSNITASGRLTKDVETRQVGDHTVTSFTLAANNALKEGETNFFTVESWDRDKELGKYIQKGSLISVAGKLSIDNYSYDKDGETKTGTKVKILSPQINFLDKKREGGQATGSAAAASPVKQAASGNAK